MHDDERIIRAAWRSVVARDRAPGSSIVRALAEHEHRLDGVLARHREPHRRYHTVAHVAWVVRWVDELGEGLSLAAASSMPTVRLAAIFHDAVYDPRAADNEARSADLAVDVARGLSWADAEVERIRQLILATAHHDAASDDPSTAVLLDADLAVLGADPAVYRAYADGVRAEYAHLDDATWRRGRPEVLQRFLAREHIYTTAPMRDRCERRARANITAELAALERAAG